MTIGELLEKIDKYKYDPERTVVLEIASRIYQVKDIDVKYAKVGCNSCIEYCFVIEGIDAEPTI